MSQLYKRKNIGALVLIFILSANIALGDWPQWGGSSARNCVAKVTGLPKTWQPGDFDRKTGKWDATRAENIKWTVPLGSISCGTPAIADGRIFVGTNNMGGRLKRAPAEVDLKCLLCFRESDGQFLWQFSSETLSSNRLQYDVPLQGLASSPLVEGDRAWIVTNRAEVVCLDTQGFYDGEDDGPIVGEEIVLADRFNDRDAIDVVTPLCDVLDQGKLPKELHADLTRAGEKLPGQVTIEVERKGTAWSCPLKQAEDTKTLTIRRVKNHLRVTRPVTIADKDEADVVWRYDMLGRLGITPHSYAVCSMHCSVTSWGNTLFVCTGNGVTADHRKAETPDAPSFIALDKRTGEVLWTSNLPGANIHHGQWSSPAVGMLGGVPQVIFCGGDGWVYSFHAEKWQDSRPQLLWKFDTNPKDAVLKYGGLGNRNEPIAPPVLYDNKVFVTIGQEPEHGEGQGCLWCIDPTKKLDGSDVSEHLVLDFRDKPASPRRETQIQECKETRLEKNGLDLELNKAVASQELCKIIGTATGWQPLEGTTETLIPGQHWELSCRDKNHHAKILFWKRKESNKLGEIIYFYDLHQRTGERIVDNPNSAVVWKYDKKNRHDDGEIAITDRMNRTLSSVVIHDNLVCCSDYRGIVHCLDLKTGKPHWTYDMLAACWGNPLIAAGRLFVSDEDGDLVTFELSADPTKAGSNHQVDKDGKITFEPKSEVNMLSSIYCGIVANNGVLYVASRFHLFAIAEKPTKP